MNAAPRPLSRFLNPRFWKRNLVIRIRELNTNATLIPKLIRVRAKAPADNLFHCCVQKTGSQWIRAILADYRTYRYSGLLEHAEPNAAFFLNKLTERAVDKPYPLRTIISPLYIDYPSFAAIPKTEKHRTFFVTRDPRDIIVSWYFSIKHHHKPNPKIEAISRQLNEVPMAEGLIISMDFLAGDGLFESLRSWADAQSSDPRVKIIRYEDLISANARAVFAELFAHLEIPMPAPVLHAVLHDYSFEALSDGRKPGTENLNSHARKGVAGDWKNHFDAALLSRFHEANPGLLEDLGYSND
ncbi:MAG: sulfotransferase domain-containing protein [Verrucomicrobia bacterium]|nr:sulfotransferase domain-containing protein [Kiritimatiellia bacterium]MCB1102688.1 sulfotransferase domain-containing protein [Kiritimatiellia bacterium]MCP5489113.1 sulfotransferase domain-containing protein [Verrucomicrobiota bacterium]